MNEELRKLLNTIIKEKGGSYKDYRLLMDKIGYHESKSDPKAIQNGGGPGRGKYQFEVGDNRGGNTAVNRTYRYMKDNGIKPPQWLNEAYKNKSTDASQLKDYQQDIMFLGNMMGHPKANFKNVIDGKESTVDFWSKYHWAGKNKDLDARTKSFNDSMEHYKQPEPEKQVDLMQYLTKQPTEKPQIYPQENPVNQFVSGGKLNNDCGGPGQPPCEELKKIEPYLSGDKYLINEDNIKTSKNRILDYLNSPGFERILSKSEKQNNVNNIKIDRINKVKNLKINQRNQISEKGPGYFYGIYNQNTDKSVDLENYLYKGIPEHEISHASTDGNNNLNEFTKNNIKKRVTHKRGYYNDPTEAHARIINTRLLLKHANIWDYNKREFNSEDLKKLKKDLKENPDKYRIQDFLDLKEHVNSDKDFIWLMNNIANNDINKNINKDINIAANGGRLNSNINQSEFNEFNSGGSHESNPHGGIPMGTGQNGKLNTVEQNETSYEFEDGKYIFSARLGFDKKLQKQNINSNQFANGGNLNNNCGGPGQPLCDEIKMSNKIKKSEIQNSKDFILDYLDSPKYKERKINLQPKAPWYKKTEEYGDYYDRLRKQDEQASEQRFNDLNDKVKTNVKTSEIEYIDEDERGFIDELYRKYKGKKDLHIGSYYNKSENYGQIHYDQVLNIASGNESLIAHELSHNVDKDNPMEVKLQKEVLNRIKGAESLHDLDPEETKADVYGVRYLMKKYKIQDAGKEDFTKDTLKEIKVKLKKDGTFQRLQRLYKDEDIIWLMNNIAQTNIKKQSNTRLT